MTVLVLADHENGALKKETRHVVAAARALGTACHVLVCGQGVDAIAQQAAAIDGVSSVITLDDPLYAHGFADALAPPIVGQMAAYGYLLGSGTSFAKNLLPRVAALLGTQMISDVLAIHGPKLFSRPIYAGNAIARVESRDDKIVASVRTTAYDPAGDQAGSASVVPAAAIAVSPSRTRFIGQEKAVSERPTLTAARVVISGGRGVGSAENFALLDELAAILNAALGASRAAVDAGYVPNDYQVGQTGKVVAPDLYIAIGISGAIQHLAGMKDSKIIVAINKDPDAPIFNVADYGLVGDLFQIVPELIAALKKR